MKKFGSGMKNFGSGMKYFGSWIRNKYTGSTALLSGMKIPNYGHTKKEPS
jgi:hypothetical protein